MGKASPAPLVIRPGQGPNHRERERPLCSPGPLQRLGVQGSPAGQL